MAALSYVSVGIRAASAFEHPTSPFKPPGGFKCAGIPGDFPRPLHNKSLLRVTAVWRGSAGDALGRGLRRSAGSDKQILPKRCVPADFGRNLA